MSNLTKNPTSIEDFIQVVFNDPKPIFFWDSCSILDMLRLPYRKGTLATLQAYISLKGLIDDGTIYSVFSELSITEWNEHQQITMERTNADLTLTSEYHRVCIEMINHIFGSTLTSENLANKGLITELEKLADEILDASYFLIKDTIANAALDRVTKKLPPSKKKPEFKDCAIWETVLEIARSTQHLDRNLVFFTVNTDDYVDKGRVPQVLHVNIASEAVTFGIKVEITCEAALASIL